jgi:hypothetical protein
MEKLARFKLKSPTVVLAFARFALPTSELGRASNLACQTKES